MLNTPLLVKGRPVVPGTEIGLLSKPGKMPGFSFSLPAGNAHAVPVGVKGGTCPGAVYGDHPVTGKPAVCRFCYANPDSEAVGKKGRRGGRYGSPNVVRAQKARARWLLQCLKSEAGQEEWVETMAAAIFWATRTSRPTPAGKKSKRVPFFRIHDSGDVMSDKYGYLWERVVARLQDVRFWMPTRSWHDTPRVLVSLVAVARHQNIAVKPSGLWVDDAPPEVPGLDAGTGVSSTGHYNCPAKHQGNQCGECRRCWDKGEYTIYPGH